MRHGNEVIGMGGLTPIPERREVELCRLHLDGSKKGQKLGLRMAHHLIETAKEQGFTHMVLHVTDTQKEAIRLYQGLGFKITGTKRDQGIKDGQKLRDFNSIHMELDLATYKRPQLPEYTIQTPVARAQAACFTETAPNGVSL